jgi:glycosyltransferase involved in cell wall biosynthesis
MPRVIVVGDGDPVSLGSSYVRAFRKIGCEASLFDHYGVLNPNRNLAGRLNRVRLLAQAPLRRRVSAMKLLSQVRAERPELVFLTKCDDLPGWLYPLIRRLDARVAAFHPDDPFWVRRAWRKGPSHRRSVVQMRAVDHYFVWAEHLVQRIRALGVPHVSYLGFAVDPELSYPVAHEALASGEPSIEVSFVGTWDQYRESWLHVLAEHVPLSIWGSDYWRDRCRSPLLQKAWRGKTAEGDAFSRVVSASRLSVNILREQNEGGENMRTYEIPGCGGAMIANYSAAQDRVFRDGREAFYARTPVELAQLAARLLAQPELVERVRRAALERSREHHYTHRATTVIETIFGASHQASVGLDGSCA